MGYYTRIDTTIKVKEEYKNKLRADIYFCKKHSADYLSSTDSPEPNGEHPNFKILRKGIGIKGDYVFWHIEEILIDFNNRIYWDDEQKFYGEHELVEYLKEKVTAGDLICKGEDGEIWGYRFDGEGGFKELKMQMVEK